MHGSLGTLITSFKYQLKSWNAKAVLLTECQRVPAQISHSGSSPCAFTLKLPDSLLRWHSRSDQSTATSSMRRLIHFSIWLDWEKNHSLTLLGFGHLLHTHNSNMPIILLTRGLFKMKSSQISQYFHPLLNLKFDQKASNTKLGKFKTLKTNKQNCSLFYTQWGIKDPLTGYLGSVYEYNVSRSP